MKKFEVNVILTFNGTVTVKAKNELEAIEKASMISARLDDVSDGGCSNILDWDIEFHPEVETEEVTELDDDTDDTDKRMVEKWGFNI